jgi:tetratricopeptide (TPR) repeat protein
MGHSRTLLSLGWIYLFGILAGCSAGPRNISEDVDALVQALSLESTELSGTALQKIGRAMKEDDLLRVLKEAEDLTSNELWIPFFESLYQYYPKPPIAYLLAEAKCRSGKIDSGMSILNEAIQEGFSDESLLQRAALLAYTQKHYAEAQKWLEQLLEVNPKNGEALFLRGTILSREKYFDRARIDLQAAIELDPNHRLAEYELGVLEDRAGNHERAERHLRSVIDKQPFFIEAYKGLLSVLIKQGKREDVNRFETIAEYLATWDREKIQSMWVAFTNPDTLSHKRFWN